MQESIFDVAKRYFAESKTSMIPLRTHSFLRCENTSGQIVSLGYHEAYRHKRKKREGHLVGAFAIDKEKACYVISGSRRQGIF